MNYYQKYIKYKNKYKHLRNQMGGLSDIRLDLGNQCITANKTSNDTIIQIGNIMGKIITDSSNNYLQFADKKVAKEALMSIFIKDVNLPCIFDQDINQEILNLICKNNKISTVDPTDNNKIIISNKYKIIENIDSGKTNIENEKITISFFNQKDTQDNYNKLSGLPIESQSLDTVSDKLMTILIVFDKSDIIQQIENTIQEQEDILDKINKDLEDRQTSIDLIESTRISKAEIDTPFELSQLEEKTFFPKKWNEISFQYTIGDKQIQEEGFVIDVSDTQFKIFCYESGMIVNNFYLSRKKGTMTITKQSLDSPGDCLKSIRTAIQDYVIEDLSKKFIIISFTHNNFAYPGNPMFDIFCKHLKKEYPIIIGYHGTPRYYVKSILQSIVIPGDVNYYGEGAYFTTSPLKAFGFGSHKSKKSMYQKYPIVRDIIVCVLSLNPSDYDYSYKERPKNEIVNTYILSHIPLFHARVRLKPDFDHIEEPIDNPIYIKPGNELSIISTNKTFTI